MAIDKRFTFLSKLTFDWSSFIVKKNSGAGF